MSVSNLHTHTVFCDGKDTPQELVEYAISCGCNEIGFSGHGYTDIPDEDPFCMTPENTRKYLDELRRLKEIYKGRINIRIGVEQDYFSEVDQDEFEYVIGSVHYVLKDGKYLPIDESKELFIDIVKKYYDGDYYKLAADYYALAGDIYSKTKCDIVGHFDLITKYNEGNTLFETSDPRYVKAADDALEKLLKEDVIFEINHGAVARGYRTTPYPEERIIEKIRAAKKSVIHTSDCHSKEELLFGLDDYQ